VRVRRYGPDGRIAAREFLPPYPLPRHKVSETKRGHLPMDGADPNAISATMTSPRYKRIPIEPNGLYGAAELALIICRFSNPVGAVTNQVY